ncbi:MAG: NfeD family protein, partial [Pseudomonas sp.]
MAQQRLISWFFILAALLVLAAPHAVAAKDGAPLVHVVPITGTIGPATFDLVKREIATAQSAKASLLILQIDTPGGLYDSTQQIVQALLDSPVPVATLVAPAGAHAASAGTYILYASHISAMAPSTRIGAATPITINGDG